MSYGPYRYENGQQLVWGGDGRWWVVTEHRGGDDYGYPLRPLQHGHHAAHLHAQPAVAHYHGARHMAAKVATNPWSGERVSPVDGMAENPLAQAVFHSDAGRRSFYYAPYEVDAFATAPLALLYLVSPLYPATLVTIRTSQRRNPEAYGAAQTVLNDFLYGTSDRHRIYLQQSVETQSLMRSAGFQQMMARIQAKAAAGSDGTGDAEGVGSWKALRNMPYDLMHSPIGGQVGGYIATWHAYHGRIYVDVVNDAGADSFFFHGVPNLPDDLNGPFNTIHQEFFVNVPMQGGAH